MDQVVLLADGEVATHCARGGGGTIGGTQKITDHTDGFIAFEHTHNHGATRNEVDQTAEKWSGAVLGVVLFGQQFADLDQLQADNLEALGFKPGENGPGKAALNAVGLEDDECVLHRESVSRKWFAVDVQIDRSQFDRIDGVDPHRHWIMESATCQSHTFKARSLDLLRSRIVQSSKM